MGAGAGGAGVGPGGDGGGTGGDGGGDGGAGPGGEGGFGPGGGGEGGVLQKLPKFQVLSMSFTGKLCVSLCPHSLPIMTMCAHASNPT